MRFCSYKLRLDDRGITGLETAIILIAFVVVASVFAFTILSSGVFADRSKQAVYAGLQDTRSTVQTKGSARAYRGFVSSTEAVYKISFTITNAIDGEPVDLTPPYTADGAGTDPDVVSGAEYVTVISYSDEDQYFADVPWTVQFIGFNNGDNLLEVGEAAEMTVWLLDRNTAVTAASSSSAAYMNGTLDGAGGNGGTTASDTLLVKNNQFVVEMKPPRGAIVGVNRKIPPSLRTVMDLR